MKEYRSRKGTVKQGRPEAKPCGAKGERKLCGAPCAAVCGREEAAGRALRRVEGPGVRGGAAAGPESRALSRVHQALCLDRERTGLLPGRFLQALDPLARRQAEFGFDDLGTSLQRRERYLE